jgi:hypothetical protein
MKTGKLQHKKEKKNKGGICSFHLTFSLSTDNSPGSQFSEEKFSLTFFLVSTDLIHTIKKVFGLLIC